MNEEVMIMVEFFEKIDELDDLFQDKGVQYDQGIEEMVGNGNDVIKLEMFILMGKNVEDYLDDDDVNDESDYCEENEDEFDEYLCDKFILEESQDFVYYYLIIKFGQIISNLFILFFYLIVFFFFYKLYVVVWRVKMFFFKSNVGFLILQD